MIFLSVFLGVFFGILCAELVLFLLRRKLAARRASGPVRAADLEMLTAQQLFQAQVNERRKTKNISKSGNLVLGGDHDGD